MQIYLLALSVPVTAVALLYSQWEYRRRGKLTFFGLFLICVMFFVPIAMLDYAMRYEMPDTPLDYFGVVISIVGIVICLLSIAHFRSMLKVLCVDAGKLTTSGPYRWSRNPQLVGFFLVLLGFALNDWSLWCLVALLVAAINFHLLVLVEEEHLRGVFGEQYVDFCFKTPRYAGWGRLRI